MAKTYNVSRQDGGVRVCGQLFALQFGAFCCFCIFTTVKHNKNMEQEKRL